MNLEERHWERLLADIQGRQVIPVIGPELLSVEVEGKPVTLYRHLAKQRDGAGLSDASVVGLQPRNPARHPQTHHRGAPPIRCFPQTDGRRKGLLSDGQMKHRMWACRVGQFAQSISLLQQADCQLSISFPV